MLSYVVFVHSAGKNVGMTIFDHDRHDNIFSSVSHCSPFNCCLSVVLWLDKGDYPENSHVVFRPNGWLYFEPFMGLGLANDKYLQTDLLLIAYTCMAQKTNRWIHCNREGSPNQSYH